MAIINLSIADWKEPLLPVAVCALTLSPEEFGKRFDVSFTEFLHELGTCKAAVIECAGHEFWLEGFPEAKETNFVSIFCLSSEAGTVGAIDKPIRELDLAKDEIEWVRKELE